MFRYLAKAAVGAAPVVVALAAQHGLPASARAGPSSSTAASADDGSDSSSSSLTKRLARRLELLSLYAGASTLHCEAVETSAEGTATSELYGDAGEGGGEGEEEAPSDVLNPGDFSHREDEKSFNVSPPDGVMLLMQSSVGNPGRDSAAVATQMMLGSGGAQSVWIISDQKSPGLQAVLQPGQEGKLIKLSVNGRPGAVPGLQVEAETLLGAAGVQSVKGSGKYNGDDFFASLAFSPMGQGPPNAELNYHQTVAPGWTAGGTFAAAFSGLVPVPAVQRIVWGTYGSWIDARRRDKAMYWRFGAQPRPDGSETQSLALQTWHRVNKGLELGANLNVTALAGGGPAWLPLPVPAALAETTAGVGGRMTFDGPGGLNPVLTAHFNTQGVASLQWQKPSASGMTNTFMRTTLSAVLDHPKRDYKWGLQLELYY